MGLIIYTGIDIEKIDRIRTIPPEIRQRFVSRIVTPVEFGSDEPTDESLIGIFCAKEAVAKALGCGIGEVSWQDITIIKDAQDAPQVALSGRALDIACDRGIENWSISISHTRDYATSIAIGYGSK